MKLERIIENHTRTIGGRDAVEAVFALRINFHLTESTFAVDGVYAASRSGRMRVDIFADETRVFTEGFDGQSGWQLPQDAAHCLPTSPEGTAALLHGIEKQLYGLHELEARGHQLKAAGQVTVGDAAYETVDVHFADGHTLKLFISRDTWRIERSQEHKALHPDLDATQLILETRYFDFRPVGRLLRPFRDEQVNLSSGQVMQSTIVRAVEINPTLAPRHFDCPLRTNETVLPTEE